MVSVNGNRFLVADDGAGWSILDLETGKRERVHNFATALYLARLQNEKAKEDQAEHS